MATKEETAAGEPDADERLRDGRGRQLADLRISVTDRCNFRCRYCMPREAFGPEHPFLPRAALLSFEELTRVAKVFAGLGVRKLRLTGGEPLLRRDLSVLVERLAAIPDVDLALTTNGALLGAHAERLKHAGLKRVTVSLDTLDDERFQAINDAPVPVAQVLSGIDAAARAGLGPIKINCVVQRGVNDDGVVELARRFKGTGHIVRFIEFMDVGITNGWRLDKVVSGREIVERIDQELPLEPADPNYSGEVAARYRYRDGDGEIGVITSVTQAFCRTCTRARLSAEGQLYTCLFATRGFDLRSLVRGGVDDQGLANEIRRVWLARDDRYSELRSRRTAGLRRIEMSYIGG